MLIGYLKKIWQDRKNKNRVDLSFYHDIDLFQKLTDKELIRISDLFIYKNFKKDEIIFRESYPHVVLYIVRSGKVKLYQETDGVESIIDIKNPKEIFGEVGLFIDVDRLVSAVALEDSELIAINKTDFYTHVKNHHGTGIKLLWNVGRILTQKYFLETESKKDYESKK
jgi:CRP-like cAMP-binding protein